MRVRKCGTKQSKLENSVACSQKIVFTENSVHRRKYSQKILPHSFTMFTD